MENASHSEKPRLVVSQTHLPLAVYSLGVVFSVLGWHLV